MADNEIEANATISLNSENFNTFVDFHGISKVILYIEDVARTKASKKTLDQKPQHTRRCIVNIAPLSLEPVMETTAPEYDVRITQGLVDGDDVDDTTDCKQIFGFRTPKRSRVMNKVKPQSSGKVVESNRKSRNRPLKALTPSRLEARFNVDDEFSEDSLDSTDDEDKDEELDMDKENRSKHPGTFANMAEDYFKAQSGKSITSDHTLAKLKEDGILDYNTLKTLLTNRRNSCTTSSLALMSEHRAMFKNWMLQLCFGFNIILYGYGSKLKLLEEFRKKFCKDYHCVVVNGYFPSITLKSILNGIADCLKLKGISGDPDTIISSIIDYVTDSDESLFVFIHNIDGSMLRSVSVQSKLATLASAENIHFVVSVDHINSPLMWNQSTVMEFKWSWYDATTFEPYIEETSYENSLITQQSGGLALKSMINVYKSLTPNARNILILMTKYHVEHCEEQSYIGMPFQMLYLKCREAFLVNSDQTLKTQLIEFRDHKMIRSRKGADGAEHLFFPADTNTLQDFIEHVQSE